MHLGTLDRTPPPFFRQGTSALTKLVFFSALAVFLMVSDTRFGFIDPVRLNQLQLFATSGEVLDAWERRKAREREAKSGTHEHVVGIRIHVVRRRKELGAHVTDAAAQQHGLDDLGEQRPSHGIPVLPLGFGLRHRSRKMSSRNLTCIHDGPRYLAGKPSQAGPGLALIHGKASPGHRTTVESCVRVNPTK
jgi:hypothetical protein